MKRLILFFCLLLITPSINASHLMGGEITWKIDSLQRYIFEIKLYRDCNGVSYPSSVILTTNADSNGINCSLINVTDISPKGYNCPTCDSPGGNLNAVHEVLYRSQPVTLPSVVPVTGFYFYYFDCCRNSNITNLNNVTGGGHFLLRAIMYADGPNNTLTKTDNSPQFLISPTMAVLTGELSEYSHAAYDPELDSLSFAWGMPLFSFNLTFTQAYPFNPQYSYTSPLPGPWFHPLNIPATLSPTTGLINFKSFNTGAFVTVVKVTSWKCGIKTSEIFREIQIAVMQDSYNTIFQPSFHIIRNNNPEITISKSGNITYNDTLYVGESASYNLMFSDTNLILQTTTLPVLHTNSFSPHFGTNFTDSLNGCLIAPCATLLNPGLDSGSFFLTNTMNFTAACAHASFINGCLQHQRSYPFTFKVNDDACPANGVNFKTLNINVRGPLLSVAGNFLYIPNNAGIQIQWHLNGVPIAGATDTIVDASLPGIYSAIVTQPGGCIMVTNSFARSAATGINETIPTMTWNVYADVYKNLQIVIESPASIQKRFDIYTINGQLIKSFPVHLTKGPQHLSFEMQDVATGIYLLNVEGTSKKFIIP